MRGSAAGRRRSLTRSINIRLNPRLTIAGICRSRAGVKAVGAHEQRQEYREAHERDAATPVKAAPIPMSDAKNGSITATMAVNTARPRSDRR